MPWYKTGTVSVTQNSNAVIGAGTAFIANSRVGDGFRGPDGRWYEVTNIASNTALSISPNYEGPTVTGGLYSIMPVQGYQKDLADQVRAILNEYGEKLAALGTTGNYETLPVSKGGTGATTASDALTQLGFSDFTKTLVDDANAGAARTTLVAAKSGPNSDITELNALTKPVTPAQGGTSPGYIDGLLPTWLTTTSITISSGSAYVPSLGKVLTVSSPITLTGQSGLTPDAFYYFYLYDNAGTPTIERVITYPSDPYFGKARSKLGDSSRRLLFALRTNSTGLFYPFKILNTGMLLFAAATNTAPFRVLAGGTSTTYATISLASVVPVSSQTVSLRGSANGTAGLLAIPGIDSPGMTAFDVGARYQVDFATDSQQRIQYANAAAGGTLFIDVTGYGMDR